MATRAELKASMESLVGDAEEIIAAVAAGDYATAQQFEADVNVVRREMATLIDELYAEWGLDAAPAVRSLRALAAQLLDLRAGLTEAIDTLEETVDRVTSLPELAAAWYGDPSRWTELAALNPGLRHPGFILAGDVVVRHAR